MAAPTGQHQQPDLGVRLERRRDGDVEVVAVGGVLDVASAPTLRSCLLEIDDGVDVRLEVGALDFVDSTGIGVLVAAAHRLRSQGQGLVVAGARPAIRAVLEVTGVDRLLSVPPSGGRPSGSG